MSLGFTVVFEGGKVYRERDHRKSEHGFLSKTNCTRLFLNRFSFHLWSWQVASSVIHIPYMLFVLFLSVLHFMGNEF